MNTGFLFPGQGGQKMGMLKEVPERYLRQCFSVTGISLQETTEAYEDTIFIQLALVVKAAFYIDQLKAYHVFPKIVAGHSIGAYSAALASETLTFEECLFLVYNRAKLMKESFPNGYGMGVLVGLSRQEVQELVDSLFDPDAPVYVSNDNSPLQQTISGSLLGMKQILNEAKQHRASTAKILKVPVPSHCLLMAPIVNKLATYFDEVTFKTPICPYVKNIDSRKTEKVADIRQDLLSNLAYPVLWNETMDVLKEFGMTIGIEIPPGDTLTKLVKTKFLDEVRIITIDQHGMEDAVFLYEKWR